MDSLIEPFNRMAGSLMPLAGSIFCQSSVLILIVLALDYALADRVRASVRYAVWMIVLLKFVLPPSLAIPTSAAWWLRSARQEFISQSPLKVVEPDKTPVRTFEPRAEITAPIDELPIPSVLEPVDQSERIEISPTPSPSPMASTTPVPIFHPPLHAQQIIPSVAAIMTTVWIAVSVVLLGFLVRRWRRILQEVREGPAASVELNQLVRESAITLGLRQSVAFRISEKSIAPTALGLRNPTIVLPKVLTERLTTAQIKAVLMHEMIHVLRGDLWVNSFQTLLQIIFWWHPLLWIANQRIRRVREEAVDDAVMRALKGCADLYPATLLEVAKATVRQPILRVASVGILESHGALHQRVSRLLDYQPPRVAGFTWAACLGICAFTLIALPMGQPPANQTTSPTATKLENSQPPKTTNPTNNPSVLLIDENPTDRVAEVASTSTHQTSPIEIKAAIANPVLQSTITNERQNGAQVRDDARNENLVIAPIVAERVRFSPEQTLGKVITQLAASAKTNIYFAPSLANIISKTNIQSVVDTKIEPMELLKLVLAANDLKLVEDPTTGMGKIAQRPDTEVRMTVRMVELKEQDGASLGLDWLFGQSPTNDAPSVVIKPSGDLPLAGLLDSTNVTLEHRRMEGQTAELTSAQFDALLERFNANRDINLVTFPLVVAASGEHAQVVSQNIKTIVVGVGVTPPNIITNEQNRAVTNGANVNYRTEQLATGPSVDLVPRWEDGKWRISAQGRTTEFLGYEEPRELINVSLAQSGSKKPLTAQKPLPKLRVSEVVGTASVPQRSTLALRGPQIEEVHRTKGTLLHRATTSTVRKRIYVFVTVWPEPVMDPVKRKLASWFLDDIYFNEVPLPQVVKFFNEESKKVDPEKEGLVFAANSRDLPVFTYDTNKHDVSVTWQKSVDPSSVIVRMTNALHRVSFAVALDAVAKNSHPPLGTSFGNYEVHFTPFPLASLSDLAHERTRSEYITITSQAELARRIADKARTWFENSQPPELFPAANNDVVIQRAKERLQQKLTIYEQYKVKYKDEHPVMKELQTNIALERSTIAQQARVVYTNLLNRASHLAYQRDTLSDQLRKLDKEMSQMRTPGAVSVKNDTSELFPPVTRVFAIKDRNIFEIEETINRLYPDDAMMITDLRNSQIIVSTLPRQMNEIASLIETFDRAHAATVEKLNTIMLGEIQFEDRPLSEVLKWLTEESKRQDPEKKGIDFSFDPSPKMEFSEQTGISGSSAKITVRIKPALRNVSASVALKAITSGATEALTSFVGDSSAVILRRWPYGDVIPIADLQTRMFNVNTQKMMEYLGRSHPGLVTNSTQNTQDTVRAHLASMKISVLPPNAVFLNDRKGYLMIRATPAEISSVQSMIETNGLTEPGKEDFVRRYDYGPIPKLETRFFVLDTNAFTMRLRDKYFGNAASEQKMSTNYIDHILNYLESSGIRVKPPNAVFYKDRKGWLMLRATAAELEIADRVLPQIKPPQN